MLLSEEISGFRISGFQLLTDNVGSDHACTCRRKKRIGVDVACFGMWIGRSAKTRLGTKQD